MLLPESQRLMKANAARELGSRVAFNFEDLRQQGDAYLAQVREQAEALIRTAQQEAAALREQTLRDAQEQGRREGLQDAARLIEEQTQKLAEQRVSARLATTLPAVAAIAQTLRQELDNWLLRWEESAVRTAVAIAEKIIHRQLELRPEFASDMVSAALRLAAGHPQLRIQLHPDDIANLGDHADDVVRTVTACADAVLIPNPDIARGGCRIETRHGEIDARLETMLARMAEELLT